jgi:hypothetical protein
MIAGCVIAIAGYVMLVSCETLKSMTSANTFSARGQDSISTLWRLLSGSFRSLPWESGQSFKLFRYMFC